MSENNGQQGAAPGVGQGGTDGGTGQGQQGQQQGAGQGQQGEPFWNTLPENMRGSNAEDTLKKLMPSWQGYHKQWTERGEVLTKPEEFSVEISNDKAKPHFDPKSPMATAFAKAAVEMGLTKKQAAGLADKVMGGMAEAGAFADVLDVKANVLARAGLLGHKELTAEAKAALETAETEMTAWAGNYGKQLGLSEAGQVELESLVLTPGGFEIIRAMQKLGNGGIAVGGAPAGAASKDDIFARLNDERSNPLSPKYDKAFHEKAEADYDALRKASR